MHLDKAADLHDYIHNKKAIYIYIQNFIHKFKIANLTSQVFISINY